MASLRSTWLAMALMLVAVSVMGGLGYPGPGVGTADDNLGYIRSLKEGESMVSGWTLGGQYDGYDLHLQQDCNLVLYPDHSQTALWASNTAGRAQNCILVMQRDCNAVLYESGTQNALWASGTTSRGSGCTLWVQPDGNVVIYDANGIALWATNTVQP